MNPTNKSPAAQYDGLGFSDVKFETVVSSVSSNHVLGKFKRGTDIIDEQRE